MGTVLGMEDTINRIIPNANFKYPVDYLEYDGLFDLIRWVFPKGAPFIQDCLSHLKAALGIENLVPFATNGEKGEDEKYACFLIDGTNNNKVVTIHPFGTLGTICQQKYEDVWDWYLVEMIITELKEDVKSCHKIKDLGISLIDDADATGPVVAISKQLLEGHRLIMTTDAGVWYAMNDDIKNTVETCGCGLRVLSVRKIENEDIEVIIEGLTEYTQKFFLVKGDVITPPADIYFLSTPFAGEYFLKLEVEDADGNREFLWSEDYIWK